MEGAISRAQEVTQDKDLREKLKQAGLISYTLNQVWNKQGKF